MISISSIFRKNGILAGLLILFSLSIHSTLFSLSKNAQDSSVARFDSANMDEVVIPPGACTCKLTSILKIQVTID